MATLLPAWSATAGEVIQYAPPSGWVRPVAFESPEVKDGGAIQILLLDNERFYGPDGEQHYTEMALRALTPQGLNALGAMHQTWNPATENLTIHKLTIVRDGKVIDLLADADKFTALRRETNLSMAMLDGRLTATKQVVGLQVGDVVNFASTVHRNDPMLNGRSEFRTMMGHPGVANRVRFREVWPDNNPMRWRVTDGLSQPVVTKTELGTELVIDQREVKAPIPPDGAPARYSLLGVIEVTEFRDWKEVSSVFAPAYEEASRLSAQSPLKAEVEKIRTAHKTPEAQAAAALKLVQEQVRYLFLAVGQSGYAPAAADLTWTRRFADCKGKTALLLALLKELDIKAEPALVNAAGGDGLDARLPGAGPFNHVLVRASINGRTYWLDGTRIGDGALDAIMPPPVDWALPLRIAGADLEKVELVAPSKPLMEQTMEIDASAGLDVDAKVTIRSLLRGDAAIYMQQLLASASRAEMQKQLRDEWAGEWLKVESVDFGPAEEGGALQLTITGQGEIDWETDRQSRAREYLVADSYITSGFQERPEGQDKTAPFEIEFPFYERYLTRVKLPQNGAGFELVGADVDETAAGIAIKRTSRLEGGEAVVEFSMRSVVREVPMEEALSWSKASETSASSRWVRVRAPRVLQQAAAGAVEGKGGSAASYDEGAALLELGRYTDAIKAFDEAIRLDPANAAALRDRSMARVQTGKVAEALEDAEAVVRLKGDAEAYLQRGAVLVTAGSLDRAIADFSEAAKLSPKWTAPLVMRASAKSSSGDHNGAQQDMELAVRLDPANPELQLLRVAAAGPGGGTANPAVLSMLDEMIRADPTSARLHLARGLEHTRRGDQAKALADYDKAIALEGTGDAYMERGLLHQAQNDFVAARADMDIAVRLQPSAHTFNNRGNLRMQQRDYDGAEEDFEAALRLEPDKEEARLNLFVLTSRRGDTRKAVAQLAEYSKTRPTTATIAVLRGQLHANLKEYEIAATHFREALRLDPLRKPQVMANLASLGAQMGDAGSATTAVTLLDEVLREQPDLAAAWNNRCWVKATRGLDAHSALADCDQALKLSPENAGYLDSRAFALLRLDRLADAVREYDSAIAKRPESGHSFFGRGLAKRRLGDVAGGDADIAVAEKLLPRVRETFAGYGMTP